MGLGSSCIFVSFVLRVGREVVSGVESDEKCRISGCPSWAQSRHARGARAGLRCEHGAGGERREGEGWRNCMRMGGKEVAAKA